MAKPKVTPEQIKRARESIKDMPSITVPPPKKRLWK